MDKCPDCGGPTKRPGGLVYHHVDCPEVTMWLLRGGEIARGRLEVYPDTQFQFVVWQGAALPWFSCPSVGVEWAKEWMRSVDAVRRSKTQEERR